MKKALSIIVCIALAVTSIAVFTACSKQKSKNEETTTNNDVGEITAGGWTKADSPVITDEFKKVFKKAVKKLTGVEYTPVAYLASQVVAGKNHCVLCKAKPVTPNSSSTYAILYIYEDLEGNAEITSVSTSSVSADYAENIDGGWAQAVTPELTADAKKALDKACETLTGAEYTPYALIATQVVAGTNYLILCEQKPSIPSPESGYIAVTVYADLDGNAEITSTEEFEAE